MSSRLVFLLLCCVFQVPVEFVAKEAGCYSQCWDVISSCVFIAVLCVSGSCRVCGEGGGLLFSVLGRHLLLCFYCCVVCFRFL